MKRRRFLKTVPTAVGAALAAPAVLRSQQKVAGAAIEAAEAIHGIDFTDAETELVTGLVNTNRDHYERIRAVPLAPEVEPAFSYRPPRPKNASGRATPNARVAVPKAAGARVAPAIEELAFSPAATLGGLIAARVVTSTDLTRMYLDRLKRFDGRLECVITLTETLALEQAARADAEVKSGRVRGPLHGVPYGLKDLFATKGIRTTWGAKPYEDQVFDYDATTVTRLQDAGAVLVAKLTTGELAIGDLWFGGRTRNPWNPETGSSGSSAGPAAAVAAGLVGFAIGTETGGSIVSPAATCGVIGLRPTYGRVSRQGVMTLRWTLDKVGPIARTVEDCALALNAIYGPDGHDETVADLPFTWPAAATVKGVRVGYVPREFEGPPENASAEDKARWPERRTLLQQAMEVYRAAGVTFVPVALPSLPAQSLYAILNAEAGAMFDELVRSGKVRELAGKGPNHRANQLRAARYIPAVEYIRAQRIRTLLVQQTDAVLKEVDAIFSPSDSPITTLANLTGHPGLAVKCGFNNGMPEAFLLTGRFFDETAILRLGHAYERATPWKDRHPTFAPSGTRQ